MLDRIRVLARIAKLTWTADPLIASLATALTIFDYAAPVIAVLGVRELVAATASANFGQATSAVVLLVLTIAGGQASGFASFALTMGLRERVGHRVDLDIAAAVAGRPDLEHLERPEYLDRLTLLREQAPNLARLPDTVLQALGVVARLGASVVLLITVDPALVVLAVCGLPAIAASTRVDRIIERRDAQRAPHQRRAAILDWYVRTAGPAKELRVFGVGSEIQARIHRDRVAADTIIRESNWHVALVQSATWAAYGVGFVVALHALVERAGDGDLNAGDVAMVVAIAAQLNGQLGAMATWLGGMMEAIRATDHYRWILFSSSPTDSPTPPPAGSEIALENVTFRYPGTDIDVLSELSVIFPAGSTIALVGENGAGKSTLVKLLTAMYPPTSGRICVGGVDVSTLAPDQWRLGQSGAFQDTPELELLVSQVIGIGQVSDLQNDEAIAAAVRLSRLEDLIENLPEGLDTALGRSFDHGTQLSGGQWQRLALARAMMRPEPELLILDEPTANLDPRAEHEVFERYAATTTSRAAKPIQGITLLISHRFSTVQMADYIIVLDHGRIIEQGSHRELLDLEGTYAELFTLQARGYH